MGLLAVVYVLILGYMGASSKPTKKNELRRSAGWEAYVYLASNGIGVMIGGMFIYFFGYILLYIVNWLTEAILLYIFDSAFSILSWLNKKIFSIELFDENPIYFHAIVVAFLSWLICEGQKKPNTSEDDYKALMGLDGVLNIVIHAMKKDSFVKVSLKSRKVYIGFVVSEQFNNVDLENIMIIPFLSGYRDNDTLTLITNCNYMPMYEKNQFLDINYKVNSDKVDDLKMLIRVDEIETISLFDPLYYEDFEATDVSQPA